MHYSENAIGIIRRVSKRENKEATIEGRKGRKDGRKLNNKLKENAGALIMNHRWIVSR